MASSLEGKLYCIAMSELCQHTSALIVNLAGHSSRSRVETTYSEHIVALGGSCHMSRRQRCDMVVDAVSKDRQLLFLPAISTVPSPSKADA